MNLLLTVLVSAMPFDDPVNSARAELRLPAAVKLVSTSFNNQSTKPFDHITLQFGHDWVHAVHSQEWESIGLVPTELTYDSPQQSIIFETRRRNGEMNDRFRTTGSSRVDHLSPVGMFRSVEMAASLGHSVQVIPGSNIGEVSWLVEVKGMAQVLIRSNPRGIPRFEVRVGAEPAQIVDVFDDWIDIGSGYQHPTTIRSTILTSDGTRIDKLNRLDQFQVIPANQGPPALVLPKDAVIQDSVAGILRNPEGTEIGKMSAAVAANDGWVGRNRWLLVSVASMLTVVAGGLWIRKRSTC